MKNSISRSFDVRLTAPLIALLLVAFGLGLQAGPVLADAADASNVQQTAQEIQGDAFGPGAAAGAASTFDQALVHQMNIQVVAGNPDLKANSTQNATNEANVSQTDEAASGDATATDGSTARSGNARAGSLALVHQMNIQVIAGPGDCTVTQDASNVANVDQTALAVSGNASASDGSSASSGDATAMNRAVIQQRNIQVYICKKDDTARQTAANAANVVQTTAAASGASSAMDGSTSRAGDAAGDSTSTQRQANFQIGR